MGKKSKQNKQVQMAMRIARNRGASNIDLLRMREIANRSDAEMERKSTENAFLFMLAIPLNVLVNDYWSKSAKKRAPKFIEDVLSLYESVQEGIVTHEQLADLLFDMAGVKVEFEWMKGKIKNEHRRKNNEERP